MEKHPTTPESSIMDLDRGSVRILIVEDTPLIQRVLTMYFDRTGFTNYVIVGTGKQALKQYKKGFDIIFLDIGLPDIDGFTVCETIRQEEKITHDHILIVAQTAYGDMYHTKAIKSGFDDYTVKPYEDLQKFESQLIHWAIEAREKRRMNIKGDA